MVRPDTQARHASDRDAAGPGPRAPPAHEPPSCPPPPPVPPISSRARWPRSLRTAAPCAPAMGEGRPERDRPWRRVPRHGSGSRSSTPRRRSSLQERRAQGPARGRHLHRPGTRGVRRLDVPQVERAAEMGVLHGTSESMEQRPEPCVVPVETKIHEAFGAFRHAHDPRPKALPARSRCGRQHGEAAARDDPPSAGASLPPRRGPRATGSRGAASSSGGPARRTSTGPRRVVPESDAGSVPTSFTTRRSPGRRSAGRSPTRASRSRPEEGSTWRSLVAASSSRGQTAGDRTALTRRSPGERPRAGRRSGTCPRIP